MTDDRKDGPEKSPARLRRERRTLTAMIELFCRDRHGGNKELCSDCRELLTYALKRLERCPFQEHKPACSRCSIHCYAPRMRENITAVMRYAGPRMPRRHPLLALFHLWDLRRKK